MKGFKRIRVFPDRDLRATAIEMAIMDTELMQRLRWTAQLGQARVVYPTAEHSRFSHSLGVLYWSGKMLSALSENYYSVARSANHPEDGNCARLNALDKTFQSKYGPFPPISPVAYPRLEITWYEQLIRVYALLHDITHIPFGHTLEDQIGFFPRHDEDIERINHVFDELKSQVKESPYLMQSGDNQSLEDAALVIIECARQVLLVGECASKAHDKTELGEKDGALWAKTIAELKLDDEKLQVLIVAFDVVSNTICADLLDYSLRDTLFASMPKTFDKAILSSLKLVQYKTRFQAPIGRDLKKCLRLGLGVEKDKLRHDVITALLDLLRTRYDLTEKVYYHHAKCAADAMLEKTLRMLNGNVGFTWRQVFNEGLGDEGVLLRIRETAKGNPEALDVMNLLRKRRYYKSAYRITQADRLNRKARDMKELASTQEGRTKIEDMIREEIGSDFPKKALIVSCLPVMMQRKIAKALIEWMDGDVIPFNDLHEKKKYAGEVEYLTKRYPDLWSMTVYIHPAHANHILVVQRACESIFGMANDYALSEYINRKYPEQRRLNDQIDGVVKDLKKEVTSNMASDSRQAAKGSMRFTEEEVIAGALESRATKLRQGNGKKKNTKVKDSNDGQGQLKIEN